MSQILQDEEFMQKATCLTNFEAAQKLGTSSVESQSDLIENARSYAQEFSQVKSETDLKSIKEYLSSSYSEYEIVTLINLLPMTPEAAKVCCPSLENKSDEELRATLDYITNIIR